MSAHPIDRLSEYIDGELIAAEREEIESHLATCADCVALVADLRAVVAAAADVEDAPPATDLWPGIARRIEERGRTPRIVPLESRRAPRRLSFSIPQLIAASIAIAVLSAAGVWTTLREPDTGATSTPVVAEAPPAGNGNTTLVSDDAGTSVAFEEYEAAVDELERLLNDLGDKIDPATRTSIDQNLTIIDAAIQQTRKALQENPNDLYLNTHLASTMQRKIDLLQGATRLARAST
jgi:hypothetical protein